MLLFTKCHHCHEEVKLPFSHPDKSEIVQEKGESLRLTCKHCQQEDNYHWNEIHAKTERRFFNLIFLVLLFPSLVYGWMLFEQIFLSNIFYNLLAVILLMLVPWLLYLELRAQEHLDTTNFNQQ